jgi:hypothetical protein
MAEFKCKRCGYISNRKANLRSHLSNKTPCKVVLENTNREHLLDEILINNVVKPLPYNCKHCNRKFSDLSNKCKHEKKCPNKPPDRSLEDEVRMLRNTVDTLIAKIDSQVSATSQNIINNNVNGDNNGTVISQNITINNFNDGALITPDNIPLPTLVEAIHRHKKLALSVLVEDLYFNKDDPQNHSLKVLGDTSLIHNDGKWEPAQTNEVTALLGDNACNTYFGYKDQSPHEFYHNIDVVNRTLPPDKRIGDTDISNIFGFLISPQAKDIDPEKYQQNLDLLQKYTNRCHPKS